MSSKKILMMFMLFLFIFCASCASNSEEPAPVLHIVEIKQMQFQPSSITVQKGDTVLFINKDILVHNVSEQTKQLWASPTINTGESYKLLVKESASYYCSIHPVMKGKIIIQ